MIQSSLRHVRLTLILALGVAVPASASGSERVLSFEDRLGCQEAIERVYYSHQIGARRPFEEAVPREVIERKVRTSLLQSVALEQWWRTLVTAESLERELERIAGNTRLPERLLEVYGALGNDSVLIQECLARPVLVERLERIMPGSRSVAPRAEPLQLRFWTQLAQPVPKLLTGQRMAVAMGVCVFEVGVMQLGTNDRFGPVFLES